MRALLSGAGPARRVAVRDAWCGTLHPKQRIARRPVPERFDPRGEDAIRDRIVGQGEPPLQQGYRAALASRLTDLERFRALLDQSRDAILLLELPSCRIIDATASACSQFGRSRGELLSDSLQELISPAAVDTISESLSRPTGGAAGWTIETVACAPDGQWRPVEVSVRPVAFGDDKYAVAVARDITDRKRAEEEIRRLSELQRAIVVNAAYMVVTADANGVITSFNPVAERMTGYAASEMIGSLTPAAYRDPAELAQRAVLFSEELGTPIEPGFETLVAKARRNLPNEYEWTYIRKDGSRFTALLSTTALRDPQGNIVGFVSIGSDVTERRRGGGPARERGAVSPNHGAHDRLLVPGQSG